MGTFLVQDVAKYTVGTKIIGYHHVSGFCSKETFPPRGGYLSPNFLRNFWYNMSIELKLFNLYTKTGILAKIISERIPIGQLFSDMEEYLLDSQLMVWVSLLPR